MSRPGVLNRRVQIWRDTGTTVNSLGEKVEDWTQVGSRYAQIGAIRGTEQFADEAIRSKQPVVIDIRYDKDLINILGPGDRIRYDDEAGALHEYDIQSTADQQGRHRYVRCECLLRSPEAARLP